MIVRVSARGQANGETDTFARARARWGESAHSARTEQ